jgi:hypothetical protein
VIKLAVHASCMLAMIALIGCTAFYKPPVDLQQSGVSQAKHDSDLADCRSQASKLSLSLQQGRNPTRNFGVMGSSSNQAATYDDQNAGDMNLVSQPGGANKFLDVCMQRKGYEFSD